MSGQKPPFERRIAPRHPVQLPIMVGGSMTETADVSVSGVRFRTAAQLAPGTVVEFSILIASAEGDVRVDCVGRIVRVIEGEQLTHAAATIDRMVFEASGWPSR